MPDEDASDVIGINAGVGGHAMSTLPLDVDEEAGGVRSYRSFPQGDGARVHSVIEVDSVALFYALQKIGPRLEQFVGASLPLLSRLEAEDEAPLQFLPMSGRVSESSDEGGHVSVMAAGVVQAVGRGMGESGLLLQGQRVELATQEYGGGVGVIRLQSRDDCSGQVGDGGVDDDSLDVDDASDISCGAVFLEADFRALMNLSVVINAILQFFLDRMHQFLPATLHNYHYGIVRHSIRLVKK